MPGHGLIDTDDNYNPCNGDEFLTYQEFPIKNSACPHYMPIGNKCRRTGCKCLSIHCDALYEFEPDDLTQILTVEVCQTCHLIASGNPCYRCKSTDVRIMKVVDIDG